MTHRAFPPGFLDELRARLSLSDVKGISEAEVARTVAGRPYGSNQAFLTKLSSVVPAPSAQQAAAYLAAK